MGYTLVFYTVPLDQLIDKIEAAKINPTDSNRAQQIFDLLREVGATPINGLNHGSSGGDWFRDEFLDTVVAGFIGSEAADNLLSRPLANLAWEEDGPWFGWLRRKELDDVVEKLDAAYLQADTEMDDEDAEETLQELSDTLHWCKKSGLDVVTVYS